MAEDNKNVSKYNLYGSSPQPDQGFQNPKQAENEWRRAEKEPVVLERPKTFGGLPGVWRGHVSDIPLELHCVFKDAWVKSPETLAASMRHYTKECSVRGYLDDHTLKNLSTLTESIEEAVGYQAKKAVFEGEVIPFLRSMRLAKKK